MLGRRGWRGSPDGSVIMSYRGEESAVAQVDAEWKDEGQPTSMKGSSGLLLISGCNAPSPRTKAALGPLGFNAWHLSLLLMDARS